MHPSFRINIFFALYVSLRDKPPLNWFLFANKKNSNIFFLSWWSFSGCWFLFVCANVAMSAVFCIFNKALSPDDARKYERKRRWIAPTAALKMAPAAAAAAQRPETAKKPISPRWTSAKEGLGGGRNTTHITFRSFVGIYDISGIRCVIVRSRSEWQMIIYGRWNPDSFYHYCKRKSDGALSGPDREEDQGRRWGTAPPRYD